MEEELLTDIELSEVLRINVRTLRNHLAPGVKKGETIRKIKHFDVGGNRRWSKRSMKEVLGI